MPHCFFAVHSLSIQIQDDPVCNLLVRFFHVHHFSIRTSAQLTKLGLWPFKHLFHLDLKCLIAFHTNEVLVRNLLSTKSNTIVHLVLARFGYLRSFLTLLISKLDLHKMHLLGHRLVDDSDSEKSIHCFNHLVFIVSSIGCLLNRRCVKLRSPNMINSIFFLF